MARRTFLGALPSLRPLVPSERLEHAKVSLRNVWRRWNKEAEVQERERLWSWVAEAEARLLQAKRSAGLLVEGVCPECGNTNLFVFKDDSHRDRSICKKCGWADSNDLQAIIRETASRIKKIK